MINVEYARKFFTQKIAAGERIILDLFGGKASQIPDAIKNFDIVAEQGIQVQISDLADIFPENSVDEIIASGPRAAFLEPAARILKLGGRIYINANFSNRYTFGTTTGKKPPDDETLSRLGLWLVRDEGSLDPKFSTLIFRRTDGTEIPRETVRTVIFERIE